MYSCRGGLLHKIPSQIDTPDGIRVYLENVRKGSHVSLFIRPEKVVNKVEERSSSSASHRRHVSFALGSQSQGVQGEHREGLNTSSIRPSRTRVSSALGSPNQENQRNNMEGSESNGKSRPRILPTPSQGMQTDNIEDDLPRIVRRTDIQRRRAACVARSNIREWCNRSPDFASTRSSPTPQSDQIKIDNKVDNLGLSLTELRAMQDEEYRRSLIVDQQKIEENQRLENEKMQQQQELEEIHQVQSMRRGSLKPEPEDGFVLKIRNGEKRRFRETDNIQELVNFIGSQPNSSINFEVSIAGISRKINTWDSNGTLSDFGIVHSAVLEVEFGIERPAFSQSSIRTYTDLICSLNEESDEEGKYYQDEREEDVEEIIDIQRRGNGSEAGLRELLLSWRLTTIDLDNCQNIKVSRRPEALWKHSVRCFGRSSFSLKKLLKVEFINESGLDEGGLRRDYLEMLFQQMLLCPLLEDNGSGYEVTCNFGALSDDNLNFELLGKMVASILIQGGPVLPTFSHTMVAYGIHGMRCATLETITDTKTKTIIESIMKSEDLSTLVADEELIDRMVEAGICCALNENTKNAIIKGLIMHGSFITKKQPMLDQFWKGTEHLGLRTLLVENQDQMERILCHSCGCIEKICGDELMKMFDITKFGRRGSNNRNSSEEVAQNFESFVHDCEDGKCCFTDGSVSLEDVLKFVTGCSKVPPGGFDGRFTVGFTEERRYPTVSTCTFEMTLPLYLTEYKLFKSVMIEAIVSGPGFGQV